MKTSLAVSSIFLSALLISCGPATPPEVKISGPANETFDLEAKDHADLLSVGCWQTNSTLSCDDLSVGPQERSVEKLESLQKKAQKRKEILSTLKAKIDLAIKEKGSSLSVDSYTKNLLLSTFITSQIGKLTGQNSQIDVQISQAKLFAVVLGYSCQGMEIVQDSTTTFESSFLFSSQLKEKKEDLAKLTAGLRGGKLKISEAGVGLQTELSTNGRERLFITGEFQLTHPSKEHGINNLSCLKARASGLVKTLSEPPAEIRQIQCQVILRRGEKSTVDKPVYEGWKTEVTFTSRSNDGTTVGRENVLVFPEVMDPEPEIDWLKGINLGVKILSAGGNLQFQAYKIATGEVISQITTPNSTKEIIYAYDDGVENPVVVSCK